MDERFADLQKRAHGEEFYELIAYWTRQFTKQEVMETLDTGALHTERHLVERDFVHHIDHPMHGVGWFIPPVAEHSRGSLASRLGPCPRT